MSALERRITVTAVVLPFLGFLGRSSCCGAAP